MRPFRVSLIMVTLVPALAVRVMSAQYIEGYTDEKSYVAGDTISFHVSTDSPTYALEIIRDSWAPQSMTLTAGIAGAYYPVPAEQGWHGAGWPVSYALIVPGAWPTGSYLARFETEDGSFTFHPFVVRNAVPGSQSRVAFVMNYNTRNAYNEWGGKSLYVSNVPGDNPHAVKVSFQRPFDVISGRGKTYGRQLNMHSYLEQAGFNPEFVTEVDIERDANILRAYHAVVLAGHHEYISKGIFDALEAHRDRGGHLAFFSGNDIYWQVRFEQDVHLMVGYKSYYLDDPMWQVDPSLVTTNWYAPPVNRPGEAFQGLRFQAGSLQYEPEDLLVQMSAHWLLAGTGLQDNEPLGNLLAAGEVDYVMPDSPPVLDIVLYARRETPLPGRNPSVPYVDAAAIYYEDSPAYGYSNGRGGQIFSGGSEVGWCNGVVSGMPGYLTVRRVIDNIIQHMLAAAPAPIQGDRDNNGVTNLADFIEFGLCLSGPVGEPGFVTPDAWCLYFFDEDIDGDVDDGDFGTFLSFYTGPHDDCNGNGTSDLTDIVGTTSSDCNATGVPDECEVLAGTSADCNTNGVPDECEPDTDCNGNGVADICDLGVGTSEDCNLNETPDECEPDTDCNSNGVQDICDLAAGTSDDCNVNGLLDVCEPNEDCNTNGAQDICDIANGTSADCDANLIPDECQPNADGDALPDACDNCPDTPDDDQTDTDGDGPGDLCDNCPTVVNADQANADGDAYGDACDGLGDLDHNGTVNLADFATFASCFGAIGPNPFCPPDSFEDSDMSQDGVINLADFGTFASHFGK